MFAVCYGLSLPPSPPPSRPPSRSHSQSLLSPLLALSLPPATLSLGQPSSGHGGERRVRQALPVPVTVHCDSNRSRPCAAYRRAGYPRHEALNLKPGESESPGACGGRGLSGPAPVLAARPETSRAPRLSPLRPPSQRTAPAQSRLASRDCSRWKGWQGTGSGRSRGACSSRAESGPPATSCAA